MQKPFEYPMESSSTEKRKVRRSTFGRTFFPPFFRVTVPKEISRYTRNFTGQFWLTTGFATLPRLDLTRSMARRGIQIGANFNYEPDRRISENLDDTNVPLSNVRPRHFCKL